MDGVQLPQDYRATMRQFTFYNLVERNSWYLFHRSRKGERLRRPWSHPVILIMGPLNWESSTLTTSPLLKGVARVNLWHNFKIAQLAEVMRQKDVAAKVMHQKDDAFVKGANRKLFLCPPQKYAES